MLFRLFTVIFCTFYLYWDVECDPVYNNSICNGTEEFKNEEIISLNMYKTVNISITREKVWCNNYFTCVAEDTIETKPTDYIRQLRPVFIAENTDVRITHPKGHEFDDISVYKTSVEGFMSCDWYNSSVALNISGDGELSVTDHLQNGINYFVFGGFNSTVSNCTSGDRIAIILRRSQCHTNTSTTCSNHGECATTTTRDSFACLCCEGYTGQYCETKIVPKITRCENLTCQHGGTCVDVLEAPNSTDHFSSAHCECGPFFTGQFCETKMDSCRSNPCRSGVCVERPPTYQCYCIPGFHGKQCEKEYDECISSPCLNGGTCVDRLDKYICACTHGHTGVNCETKIDLCYPNPCHFNSSCEDKQDRFTCTCPDGLTGATCDIQINECSSNPCQNQGTCVDLKNGFECICPITFAGIHCEYMMDVFAPPIEGPDGNNHSHNLYVVAGTLSGAIILVLIVLVACYCKMHETYRQLTWRRMKYKKRSLSCPDLESYGGAAATNKHRLSADAIWEATSLCYDNASYDSSQQQAQPIASQRI